MSDKEELKVEAKTEVKTESKSEIKPTTTSKPVVTTQTNQTQPKQNVVKIVLENNQPIEVIDTITGGRINILPSNKSLKLSYTNIYRIPIDKNSLTSEQYSAIKTVPFTKLAILGVENGHVFIKPHINNSMISDSDIIGSLI